MKTKYRIDIENEIAIVPTGILHTLFQQKYGADAVALYMFYYYHAKRQQTNRPRATVSYCARGLGWGINRARRAKKILLATNLIEDIRNIDPETKQIKGWYIRLKYIWKQKTEKATLPKTHRVESREGNALSTNKGNALSTNNIYTDKKKEIDKIHNTYKKEIQGGTRLTPKARQKIAIRLKEYSIKELVQAIHNFSGDSWWMKNNSHRGIAWFFHTQDRIEQFLNLNNKSDRSSKYDKYD